MALDRPPRSTPISQYAPPRIGSTTRPRVPDPSAHPKRTTSASWVVRSTPGNLPAFGEDEQTGQQTIVGLGAELTAALDARDKLAEEVGPTSRSPTFAPAALPVVMLLDVLDAAMSL